MNLQFALGLPLFPITADGDVAGRERDERHADTQFASAPADHMAHHTINSSRGEHERGGHQASARRTRRRIQLGTGELRREAKLRLRRGGIFQVLRPVEDYAHFGGARLRLGFADHNETLTVGSDAVVVSA